MCIYFWRKFDPDKTVHRFLTYLRYTSLWRNFDPDKTLVTSYNSNWSRLHLNYQNMKSYNRSRWFLTYLRDESPELIQITLSIWSETQILDIFVEFVCSFHRILKGEKIKFVVNMIYVHVFQFFADNITVTMILV